MSERQIFEPDGRAVPYVDQGEGPALVLLPGRGLEISYLGILANMLADEGFHVVRIGSRRSATDGGELTMHDLAQDVVDVMDHVGLRSAWIGGHSFGGAVARTVALDHLDRVNGVLLLAVETAGSSAGGTAFLTVPEDQIPDAVTGLIGDFEDTALAWRFIARARTAELEPAQSAALEATPAAEWAQLAPTVPVLIVQGDQDPIAPSDRGEGLRASAPDRVTVVAVEGGGHLFPATHAGDTAAIIEDYLDWD
ncbi:alpha/beta fold hydrolase [Microbacterium sp.]|uniref:alpha/beta fold hydrolase n=1 Tax=Microbacterium sp. TaxID=51671 RepID=UPI0039E2CB98